MGDLERLARGVLMPGFRGEWLPDCHSPICCRATPRPEGRGVMFRCGKRAPNGRILDGREHNGWWDDE